MHYRVVKVVSFLVAAIFSLWVAGTTMAQGKNLPASGHRETTIQTSAIQSTTNRRRQTRRRRSGMPARRKEPKTPGGGDIANMKEDFTRIQVLRNDIAR